MTLLHSLATELGQRLQHRGWYLVTAESCTGGWVAQAVTAIAGSSNWFDRGFVTYSNHAKQDMLGVPSEILTRYGAVSEQTVLAMVAGALSRSRAQVAVAISGIAGPTGGTPLKPVGTVWIGYGVLQTHIARCYQLNGDRHRIREQAVIEALQGLLRQVDIVTT